MASIFLSYAREDAAAAKALARALGRAGHSVWWDRHIHGGSEYAGEIEAALRNSDVVVVLWSQTSLHSSWVRDEAAEGRDSGRLVPVLLDNSKPPLGFRQIQSISIEGWSGRGNPPNFQDILAAIAARTGAGERPVEAVAVQQGLFGERRASVIAVGILAALLLALGAWWLIDGRRPAAVQSPVLAVLPFSDLSPERDKAYFAEGVAEAILTLLARESGLRVVGRSTAQQLHDAGAEADEMRRALGITHVLEGSARSSGDQLRMSVRLIDAANGQQLWAEEYQRSLDNVFAVQDEIGRAVAQRLKGSFSDASRQLTSADAYTLYLAARAKLRDRRVTSMKDALRTAREAIAADPNFAPGQALYAELIWHLGARNYGALSSERVRQLAEPHARKAIELAPNAAEGYAALGLISTGEAAVAALSKAIQLDPARAELRLWMASALARLGRNSEGLEHLKAANEMDPLFQPAMWNFAWWLAASERYSDAATVIARYAERGGLPSAAAAVRGHVAAFYRGDYSEGIRYVQAAVSRDPEFPVGRGALATFYETMGLFGEASRLSTGGSPYMRLWMSGDYRGLSGQARDDGLNMWNRPDARLAVRALALTRDWATVARLYEGFPGSEHVCAYNDYWEMQMLIDLAMALRAVGRGDEAAELLRCVKRFLMLSGRDSIRSGTFPFWALDVSWAQVYAFEGRPAEAFPMLERAIRRGMRTGHRRGLFEFPAFDPYRSMPEFARADARLKKLIAEERAEVLRMQPRAARAA